MHTYRRTDWCPHGLTMIVRDGIVHPSGVVTGHPAGSDCRRRERPAASRQFMTICSGSIRCRVCTYSRRKTDWAKAS